MQKETSLYGLRAVLEAIEANKSIDKVFLQKGLRGELFSELEQSIRKKASITVVPVEKLNRLTPNNHQGAVAHIAPITFCELDALVTAVKETKKHPLFLILDQLMYETLAPLFVPQNVPVSMASLSKKWKCPNKWRYHKNKCGAVFNIPICKVDHIKDVIFTSKLLKLTLLPRQKKQITHFMM